MADFDCEQADSGVESISNSKVNPPAADELAKCIVLPCRDGAMRGRFYEIARLHRYYGG